MVHDFCTRNRRILTTKDGSIKSLKHTMIDQFTVLFPTVNFTTNVVWYIYIEKFSLESYFKIFSNQYEKYA